MRSVPRGLDVIAIIASVVSGLIALLFVLKVQPAFRGMLSEFGTELSFVTKTALSPYFAVAIGLTPASLTGAAGFFERGSIARLTLTAAALGTAVVLPALFFIGVYLPIFSISNAIT